MIIKWMKQQIAKMCDSWNTFWDEHEESFELYYYTEYINEVNKI